MLRYYVRECFESIRNVPFLLYHSGRLASVVFEVRQLGLLVACSATYREFSFWTTNDIFLLSFDSPDMVVVYPSWSLFSKNWVFFQS
jgi:hypothetical protein